jgi:hypothetical protein
MKLSWYTWDLVWLGHDWCPYYLLCCTLVMVKLHSSRCLYWTWCACINGCLWYFYVFKHLHSTSHLGMPDAPREGHDMELNPKMVLVDPSRGWKDPGVHAWSGDVVETVQANLTDSCRILGKPRSIISLLISENSIEYISYMYCCIKW